MRPQTSREHMFRRPVANSNTPVGEDLVSQYMNFIQSRKVTSSLVSSAARSKKHTPMHVHVPVGLNKNFALAPSPDSRRESAYIIPGRVTEYE